MDSLFKSIMPLPIIYWVMLTRAFVKDLKKEVIVKFHVKKVTF